MESIETTTRRSQSLSESSKSSRQCEPRDSVRVRAAMVIALMSLLPLLAKLPEASPLLPGFLGLALAAWLGFEGRQILAWSLRRRGYVESDLVVAENEEEAEEVYFARLGAANGAQVVHRVAGVLGQVQRAQTGEEQVHVRRRLGAGRHLELDLHAVEGVGLTGGGDVDGASASLEPCAEGGSVSEVIEEGAAALVLLVEP